MKFSIYNTRLNLSANTDVIFNSVTADSVIIPKNLSLDLQSISPEMIALFREKGIIVSQDKDESGAIWDIFQNSTTSPDSFFLTINPTLMCNFRCWYCYESHKAQTVMSDDIIIKTNKFISNISSKFKNIELSFFGGEPLLEFNKIVIPICEHLRSIAETKGISYSISFTTNGFLLTDDMINKLTNFNVSLLQITLDGNEESHNKVRISHTNNSFRTIITNIHKLTKAKLPVLVRINVTSKNIIGSLDIPEFFNNFNKEEKEYLHVIVQQVWQDSTNDILDDIWALYSRFYEYGIMPWPRKFNFIKDICYADKLHSAIINYNGNIHKCTAMDFEESLSDGTLDDMGNFDTAPAFNRRMLKRRNNTICEACRIRPICNGGCLKNLIKNDGTLNYCIHPTEKDKDKVVQDLIKEQLYMAKLGLSWKQHSL